MAIRIESSPLEQGITVVVTVDPARLALQDGTLTLPGCDLLREPGRWAILGRDQ